jgi:hypothetical protein
MADRHHYRSHLTNHSPLLPNPDPRAPTQPAGGRSSAPAAPRRARQDMDR